MRQMYCFACAGRWPVTCKCDWPDVSWQDHVAKLEADMAAISALLNEAFDFLGECDGAADLRDRILKTTRIQGGCRSGEVAGE